MNVLVINCGSSSLKYQLLNTTTSKALANGTIERIGEMGNLSHKKIMPDGNEIKFELQQIIENHEVAMHLVAQCLMHEEHGSIKSTNEIDAIGHRVVQGGEKLIEPMLITDDVINEIRNCVPLAPLHAANLTGIEVAKTLFPSTPQVVVFDTEFHQTMPQHAFMYPIPYSLYEELHVRRYGFHGTSHKYVTKIAANMLNKNVNEVNLITLHLGNGCSMAAVKNGKSIDTTMGLTPLAGLMMGTRCGDIDPAIPYFIAKQKNISIDTVDNILNKESGFKGICGINDMRDIHAAIENGNKRAILAIDMFIHSIKKYIGAYTAILGDVDALVFTAGIGENDDIVRQKSCTNLENFGILIDTEKNNGRKKIACSIGKENSKVKIFVIPTNEELQIASDTVKVLGQND